MNNDQLKVAAIEALETCAIGANGFTKAYWFDEQKVKAAIAARSATYPADTAAYALNTILWLYRRLPRGYGRPPAVEQTIKTLTTMAGVDVSAFLGERDDG